jgi:hypothetical protein
MSVRDVYREMAHAFHVDRDSLIADVRRKHPEFGDITSTPSQLQIVPVRSYVNNTKTLSPGTFPGIVVPSFATHWGVAVEDTLYHLTFCD